MSVTSVTTEYYFSISVPLQVRFDLPDFDSRLELLGKKLKSKVVCDGGGTGGGTYDYSLYVETSSYAEARQQAKQLRIAACVWLQQKWKPQIKQSQVKLSRVYKNA